MDKNIICSLNKDKNYSPLNSPPASLNLFEKKEKAQLYFRQNKYNIEDILKYDNTNKEIQKSYLKLAVNELINKKLDKIKLEIIKEKIQKSGIILSKNTYEDEIIKIKDKNTKNELQYIDYKLSLINSLKDIKDKKIIKQVRNKLNLKKIFYFNHEAELSDNNYFFYYLSMQFELKLEEIYKYYYLYDYIIEKSIKYLENFSKLTKSNIYLFKYIIHLLIDKNSIKCNNDKKNVINFIEGKGAKKLELIKAIKECNKKEAKKESLTKEKIIYEIDFDDKSGFIKYKIKENSKIDRKRYKKEYDILYNYNIFNDKIIEILNKNELLNIEKKLFKNILPKAEYSEKYYEEIKPIFNRIIKEILSSKASINFFNNTYKKEYDNSNRKIEYHFNNEKVQNEIINRISFYPIFTETVNAFTNPLDLSIVINSIPGKYKSNEINYFNKKF